MHKTLSEVQHVRLIYLQLFQKFSYVAAVNKAAINDHRNGKLSETEFRMIRTVHTSLTTKYCAPLIYKAIGTNLMHYGVSDFNKCGRTCAKPGATMRPVASRGSSAKWKSVIIKLKNCGRKFGPFLKDETALN